MYVYVQSAAFLYKSNAILRKCYLIVGTASSLHKYTNFINLRK